MSIFNRKNTEHLTGEGSLFLGQPSGLLDSVNRKHKPLFDTYKFQKSIDWSEDEIDLEQSRLDFLQCPPDISGAMIENLSYQWETDTLAANGLIYAMSPFITNSDFKLAITKVAEIENTHALTYAEIIRLAAPDPNKVIQDIMENEGIEDRNSPIVKVLEGLVVAGCHYTLGNVENNQELYDKVFLASVAVYLLERLQFMSSFAHTFAIVEDGWFQGVGKYVQKIMIDEYFVHANRLWSYVLKHEMTTPRGITCYMNNREIIQSLFDEVLGKEYAHNKRIFSKYSLPNVNEKTMNKWAEYCAQPVAELLMLDLPFEKQEKSPLKYMEDYLDLDMFQNANQEADNNNYSLNCFARDIPEGKIYPYY